MTSCTARQTHVSIGLLLCSGSTWLVQSRNTARSGSEQPIYWNLASCDPLCTCKAVGEQERGIKEDEIQCVCARTRCCEIFSVGTYCCLLAYMIHCVMGLIHVYITVFLYQISQMARMRRYLQQRMAYPHELEFTRIHCYKKSVNPPRKIWKPIQTQKA